MNEEEKVNQEAEQAAEQEKEDGIEIVDSEVVEASEEAEPAESEVEDPDTLVARLQEENKALNTRVLRAHADLENFKRRSERDRRDSIRYANKKIFLEILSVLDNFDRALAAVVDPKDNFVIGVEMIRKQLTDVLTQNGVEEINSKGRLFDPYLDEAIGKEPTSEHEENMVIEVFQKGYRFQGQLLRASKVVVAVPPIEDGESEQTEEAVQES